MTRHGRTDEAAESGSTDRWYVPLMIAAGVVIALLVAGLATLEVLASRAVSIAPSTTPRATVTRIDGDPTALNRAQRFPDGSTGRTLELERARTGR